MQTPPGCFGSMLAYDHLTLSCKSCSARVDCQAKVTALRPTMIKLLDRFNDGSGRAMSYAWLTRGERAKRKKKLVDDSLVTLGLTDGLARKTHSTTARKAARRSIDPRTCALADLAKLSRSIGHLVERLQMSPATVRDLASDMKERANYTEKYALQATKRDVSFLVSMGRARRAGRHLELI